MQRQAWDSGLRPRTKEPVSNAPKAKEEEKKAVAPGAFAKDSTVIARDLPHQWPLARLLLLLEAFQQGIDSGVVLL